MTTTFAVGDNVKFLTGYPENEFSRVAKGDTGQIVKADNYDDLVTVKLDFSGKTERVFPRRLKLVTPPKVKFNIGDKVRLNQSGYTDKQWVGVEGIVRSQGLYANQYKVELTDPKGTGRPVGYVANLGGSLELIPEAKPLTINGFTVGDKVRYTGTLWKGLEGTVTSIHGNLLDLLVTKRQDAPTKYSMVTVGKTLTEACGGLGIDTYSLEKIEEPAALKVGDKVAVDLDNPRSGWHKAEGTLVERQTGNLWRVKVTKEGPAVKYYKVGETHTLTNLTLVTPFTFKDIQVGDTIRRTKTYKSGATEVREGTVGRKVMEYATDSSNSFILAYNSDNGTREVVTLELLNRSEPEPVKEVWEDAKVLTRQYKGDKHADTFVKNSDGSWTIHYPGSPSTYKIGASEKLSGYLEYAEVKVLVKA